MLDILYNDDDFVAINKPNGLLVHRSRIAADAEEFALQLLRDQLGRKVYPVHRIDRKTSGVLLFAYSRDALVQVQKLFAEHGRVKKQYLAIVRGFTESAGQIAYPLTNENGTVQDAVTNYKTVDVAELQIPSGKFMTSRYSLLLVEPVTGRMHQIRKHMSHIFHPIIGDRPHGCNKQNRIFKEKYTMNTMMLHACRLEFLNPVSKSDVKIEAPLFDDFIRVMGIMGWELNAIKNGLSINE